MTRMTLRDRILAVVQGREHDRVPFVQYDGVAAPNEEVWSVIGRENMGVIRWSAVHGIETPNCRFESEELEWNGRRGTRTTLHTPAGLLTEERLIEPALGSSHVIKHYVTDPEDYQVLMAYLRDIVVREDLDHYTRSLAELGDDGLPMAAVRRTPYQHLWILLVSLEDLALHMVDCPEVMEEVMSLLAGVERRIYRTVRQAADKVPIPFVNVPDNITAPTIGPAYFERFCVPLYNELADMLADRNVPVYVHMDGDLKPLWKSIGESRVGGIDSLSPPPDNDTSVAEAVSMWPDKRLFVNFPSSVHLAEPEVVYEQAMRILEEGGRTGRLQIQVSEDPPPGAWRKSYPEIVRAIGDFGSQV